jgi:hypothetical protein
MVPSPQEAGSHEHGRVAAIAGVDASGREPRRKLAHRRTGHSAPLAADCAQDGVVQDWAITVSTPAGSST